ncbi:hypothetical protein ACCO45_001569 [Purpureocillium lilacinum]|uniref:Uncharacterized protein n=2 Tax=Purpureocillium lilacinum TaxID=33203 RepID=A0ACC4EA70_PURLI|nr:hypothetical protein Purlil1_3076 [Purpureocillium lilacinum]
MKLRPQFIGGSALPRSVDAAVTTSPVPHVCARLTPEFDIATSQCSTSGPCEPTYYVSCDFFSNDSELLRGPSWWSLLKGSGLFLDFGPITSSGADLHSSSHGKPPSPQGRSASPLAGLAARESFYARTHELVGHPPSVLLEGLGLDDPGVPGLPGPVIAASQLFRH